MMTGSRGRFATLVARDLTVVQVAHLRERFELAEKSVLAERAVAIVNAAFDEYERACGEQRVKPGEVVVEHNGELLVLPLLESKWVEGLSRGMGLVEVKRQHEHDQYCCLVSHDSEATYGTLWQLLGRDEAPRRTPKGYDFLPEEPLSSAADRPLKRDPEDLAAVPEPVMMTALKALTEQYGCAPGEAEAMIKTIAGLRAWCCPRVSELSPGQAVWLAHGTKKARKRDPKLFVPLVLTLLTPDDQQAFRHGGEYKAAKIRQIERLTTEAWRQDGVLTNSDLEWLTGVSQPTIRKLLESYQEKFGVILPTAGTVLDMGRTLTHKKIVVEMALAGITTQEIARRIYHTPEAVDAYLRTFDRLLILRHYGLPLTAMMRVLGHSRSLIEEHLALADKHFPEDADLVSYLNGRGITLAG